MNKIATRTALLAVTAGAGLSFAAGPAAAYSDYYGAIAVSVSTGNVGYSYDYESVGEAESAAIAKCGAGDCQSLVWVANGCAAVAQAPNLEWGSGYGASRADAEAAAIAGTAGYNAEIIAWTCTSGHA